MTTTASTIQTANGETTTEKLGRTLMHEHLVIGYPGAESHTIRPGPDAQERFRICVDKVEQLKALGYSSMVDPCPSDLGRDPELAAKVGQATGFQIVIATGLYKQSEGAYAYWHFRGNFGSQVDEMAETFIRDLTDGIGSTGIRAGIIKVASGPGQITDYEKTVLHAAAKASLATGAPITTHTDQGTMGDRQQQILVGHGVPANRIVIGHSCGTDDHAYHMGIARGGSYLGFDRFGIDALFPDAKRVASLIKLIRAGAGDRVVVSHDSVWCWKGEPIPRERMSAFAADAFDPTFFSRKIVPRLREEGISEDQIEALLVANPRRYFEAGKLPALA